MRIKTFVLCLLMLPMFAAVGWAGDTFFSANFAGVSGHPAGFVLDTGDDAFWNTQDGWLNTGDGHDLITPDGYSFAVIDSPGAKNWSDYTISCRFYMKQDRGQVVLAGRWIDRTNHYLAVVEVIQGRRLLKIIKVYRGKETDLVSQMINLKDLGLSTIENGSPSIALSFSLSFVGTQITANLGGKIQVVAQDYDLLTGTAAIGEHYTQVFFKDVTIKAIDKVAVPVQAAAGSSSKIYTVQLNEFGNIQDARSLASQLHVQGYIPTVQPAGSTYRVNIGRFATLDEANKMLAQLQKEQFVFAKVVEMKSSETAATPSVTSIASESDVMSAIPEEARNSTNWQQLTPAQQRRVAEAIRTEESLRDKTQSVSEIMALKKKIDSLNENQATILNSLQQTEDQNKIKVRDINRLTAKIDSAIEGQDLTTANNLLKDLEKIDPTSPIVIMKRNKVQQLKTGTWDGYEQQKENLRKEIVKLQAEAAQAANYEERRNYWQTIIAKDPLNTVQVKRAKAEIEKIGAQIKEQQAQESAATKKEFNLRLYAGMGLVVIAVIAGLFFLYVVMRRKHANILLQMEERAIQPLQDLRDKTMVLANGGGGGGGLAFGGPQFLPNTDTSDAEFMIPDKSSTDFDAGMDDFNPDSVVVSPSPAPVSPRAEVKTQEVRVERKPASAVESGDDDFLVDFGDEEEKNKNKRVSTLPRSPSDVTPVPGGEAQPEEIAFSFDDLQTEGFDSQPPKTEAPITATEIPVSSNDNSDELVFNFDDSTSTGTGSQTSREASSSGFEMPQPSSPKAKQPASAPKPEDSIYESISLDDLSLDLNNPSLPSDRTSTSGGTETSSSNPLTKDLDLNLDLRIDMPADTSTGTSPAFSPDMMNDGTRSLTPSAMLSGSDTSAGDGNGIMFQQNFDAEATGALPQEWRGDNSSYATLKVVDDPDGTGGHCLEFRKDKGDGPTSFARTFPEISGRIGVEFDVRCDEKNKHLLGFYIEKDGDFRRSVHTVIQCIDIERPAYLRIFTKPTPYTLGSWRHIKYIIDLPNGLVDGYVDNKLVAEGVRMGTKTESLNTFSIRDNTESTGVLLLNKLVIYKVPENA